MDFWTGLVNTATKYLQGVQQGRELRRQYEREQLADALQQQQVASRLATDALNRRLAQTAEEREAGRYSWWESTRKTPEEERTFELEGIPLTVEATTKAYRPYVEQATRTLAGQLGIPTEKPSAPIPQAPPPPVPQGLLSGARQLEALSSSPPRLQWSEPRPLNLEELQTAILQSDRAVGLTLQPVPGTTLTQLVGRPLSPTEVKREDLALRGDELGLTQHELNLELLRNKLKVDTATINDAIRTLQAQADDAEALRDAHNLANEATQLELKRLRAFDAYLNEGTRAGDLAAAEYEASLQDLLNKASEAEARRKWRQENPGKPYPTEETWVVQEMGPLAASTRLSEANAQVGVAQLYSSAQREQAAANRDIAALYAASGDNSPSPDKANSLLGQYTELLNKENANNFATPWSSVKAQLASLHTRMGDFAKDPNVQSVIQANLREYLKRYIARWPNRDDTSDAQAWLRYYSGAQAGEAPKAVPPPGGSPARDGRGILLPPGAS